MAGMSRTGLRVVVGRIASAPTPGRTPTGTPAPAWTPAPVPRGAPAPRRTERPAPGRTPVVIAPPGIVVVPRRTHRPVPRAGIEIAVHVAIPGVGVLNVDVERGRGRSGCAGQLVVGIGVVILQIGVVAADNYFGIRKALDAAGVLEVLAQVGRGGLLRLVGAAAVIFVDRAG